MWRYGARPVLGSAVKTWLDRAAPSLIERERLRRLAHSTPTWIAPDPVLQAEILRREREVLEREAALRKQRPQAGSAVSALLHRAGQGGVRPRARRHGDGGDVRAGPSSPDALPSALLGLRAARLPVPHPARAAESRRLVEGSRPRIRCTSLPRVRVRATAQGQCNVVRTIGAAARRSARPFETWPARTALEDAGIVDPGSHAGAPGATPRRASGPAVQRDLGPVIVGVLAPSTPMRVSGEQMAVQAAQVGSDAVDVSRERAGVSFSRGAESSRPVTNDPGEPRKPSGRPARPPPRLR